ncbi:unnamed protein product [Paramecium pentaurelia]|uniref:Transmembrane protein n=1 Tax=Paramecium pentaurelia TaxID=43138 RepID=A0A8S1T4Z3_9CILI|nr:unnamed protein product [Paramecium pentaurelia]
MIYKIINTYLVTLFSFLANPTNFKIPNSVYALGIFIYFIQPYSKLFNNQSEPDTFMNYIATFSSYSTLIQFIQQENTDSTFWVFYAIFHLPILILIILPILNSFSSKQDRENNPFLSSVSSFYSVLLSFYSFILSEIYLEFNSQLIFSNSLIQKFVGVIFGCCSFGISQMSSFVCQTHEFNDINRYKRKISLFQVAQILKALITVSSYFPTKSSKLSIVICIILFSIISIYDSLIQRPFPSVFLTKWYLGSALAFAMANIIQIIFKYDLIIESCSIYLIIGLCPLSYYLGLSFYEDKFMKLIQNRNIQDFWIYSQELIEMYSSQELKLIVYISIRNHINHCQNVGCYCSKYGKNLKLDSNSQSIISGNKDTTLNYRCLRELNLKFDDIVKLMDSLFFQTLNHPKLKRKDRLNYLYASFLEKYSGNKLMSYYFLKLFCYKHKAKLSYFYKLIFPKIIKKLELKLIYFNKIQQENNQKEQQIDELSLETIIQIENSCLSYQQSFVQILTQKIIIWQLIEKGSESISIFIKRIYRPLMEIVTQNKKIQYEISQLSQNYENAGFLKLLQLSYLVISNSLGRVNILEQKIQELKNRDQYREDEGLNNFNLMRGQFTLIKTGLIKSLGCILSKNEDRIEAFFNYNRDEQTKITNINQLMPPHIASFHNQIIHQYIQNGQTYLLYDNRRVYVSNKNQFIFPIMLSLRNDFTNFEDCVFNVCMLKVSFQDAIMFDARGSILGMSENLFSLLSDSEKLFSYADLLKYGLIQVLFPNFYKVLNDIDEAQNNYYKESDVTADLEFEDLKSSIHINSNFISLCQQYQNHSSGSQYDNQLSKMSTTHNKVELFDKRDRELMKDFAQEQKNLKKSSRGFRLRFDLQKFEKNFKGLSQEFFTFVGTESHRQNIFTYFIIDIKEISSAKSKPNQTVSTISQYLTISHNYTQTDQRVSTSMFNKEIQYNAQMNEEIDGQEEKGTLQFNISLSQPMQPVFQVESPRIQLETPKDTERGMLSNKHQSSDLVGQQRYFKNSFDNFYEKQLKQKDLTDPKFISKNGLQDDGIREFEEELEFGQLNQQQQIQMQINQLMEDPPTFQKQQCVVYVHKIKQNKQKRILDEQQSTTSGMSKAERENLEKIYMNSKMPHQFYYLISSWIFITFISLTSVITLSIISISMLEDVITTSAHLLIPYEFNRAYINSAQQAIYLHSKQFQDENINNFNLSINQLQESITETTITYRELLNEEIDQYIKVQENNIPIKVYTDIDTFQSVEINIYDFLLSNYQIMLSINETNQLLNLISRFYDITESTDVINDFQMQGIIDDIDQMMLVQDYITFLTIGILVLPLFPYLRNYNKLNIYQEKIVLLITRVNINEFQKEVKNLSEILENITKLNTLNLVTNDFVSQEILNDRPNYSLKTNAKQQILQTKIYDVKLSMWFEVSILIFIFFSVTIYLIGGLLFSNQIPSDYLARAEQYVHLSHEYQHIQHYNLLNEMIVNNYTTETMSDIFVKYDEAIQSYNFLPLPLAKENGDLEFLNEIYYNDLCDNSNHFVCGQKQFRKSYQNGLNGVLQNIKLLFYQEHFKRYVSDEYWALIVFFPSFIEPFIYQIISEKNTYLSTYIYNLEVGCLLYYLAGGLSMTLFSFLYFYKQSEILHNQIYLIRHLLMFIPFEKFNEQITLSLLKQIKEY